MDHGRCFYTARMKLSRLTVLGAVFMCALFFGCSTAPGFDEVRALRRVPSSQQSAAILAKLKREKPDSDLYARHLAIEEAVSGNPLSTGNKVTLLQDGAQTFAAFFRAIDGANDHINLEFFIFEDIEHDGRHIVDLLVAKQRAGVQVNVIHDAIGSDQTPGEVFERLRDAGAHIAEFNPIIPFKDMRPKPYNPNRRDHRKILVVDGAIGFTGGINISRVYSSGGGSSQERRATSEPPEKWRDTQAMIEGPAVAQLQDLFLQTWKDVTGEELTGRNYRPKIANKGGEVLRIIGSHPDVEMPAFYITLLSAIRNSEEKVWIANSYFAPSDGQIEELTAAARRGVDVQLLLQGKTDSPIVRDIAHSTYATLLGAGVKIYEMDDVILHAKTATVDGVWSAVGSSNLDNRSVMFNREVDAIIIGRAPAEKMEQRFAADRAQAKPITRDQWADRPIYLKAREFFSRVLAYWM
jgi:cardiolipin synthase